MSYSIDEGITDVKAHLQALKDVQAAYPNARKEGQQWFDDVPLEKCDGFDLYVGEPGSPNAGRSYVRYYQTVGTGRVYRNWGGVTILDLFFHHLKEKNQKLYAQLLEAMKASCF